MASSNGRRIILSSLLRSAHNVKLQPLQLSLYTSSLNPSLNPSVTGLLGTAVCVRHLSWWRWGANSSSSAQERRDVIGEDKFTSSSSGEILSPVSTTQQHDQIRAENMVGISRSRELLSPADPANDQTTGDNNINASSSGEMSEQLRSNEFSWKGDVGSRPIADSWKTDNADGGQSIGTALDTAKDVDVGGSIFGSILQAPVDVVIGTLDKFQNVTGVPWWLTIIGSTLALRAALFPLTVTQLQKASQLAQLGNQLPSPVPAPGSGQTFSSQYRIFTKRRLELGAPSPAWLIAVPLVQVPLFISWIVAVRQMAIASHPGFDTGGILWFADLTVPVQGALGALFPTIVAATYFTNLQLSFKGMDRQKGLMGTVMKFYKWWLEAATIPAFIFGFYLPQGVFMYWITNNCCSLFQFHDFVQGVCDQGLVGSAGSKDLTIALQQPQVRARLGLPSLAELSKLRATSPSPSPEPAAELKMEAVHNMSSDDLLVLAANCMAMQKEDEALQVLQYAVDKFPEKAEAHFALGKIYIGRQQWSEAAEYHNLVLTKTKENELLIAASLGAGVALFNQGRKTEAIKAMSVITRMDVPKDALSQHRYFRALVTLGSALSQEGLKAEALEVLRKAAKYEPMVDKIFIPQLEEEIRLAKREDQ